MLFGRALIKNKLRLPPDDAVQDVPDGPDLPYVFVADEAFPLHKHIMQPFPGRGQAIRQ